LTRLRRYPDLVDPSRLTGGPVLCVAPHPDDETAGCGGMLAFHARAGDPVTVAILTDGARGSHRRERDEDYVRLRQAEAVAALAVLGLPRPPEFLGLPDGGLATVADLRARLAALVRRVAPRTVYAPSPFEIHADHVAAAVAAVGAAADAAPDARVLLYEIGVPVPANVLVDVTPVAELKYRALRSYASQLAANDFLPKTEGLNRYRTVNVDLPGVLFAEGYAAGRAGELAELGALAERLASLHATPPDLLR
jgi:LmbE family N-acetylglucosaminyl deacetylase